eukprot:TRINITY_DN13045_c0_g1_i1.p1 TRINITY_DN13045_c0_g1~~TRINITY_DN13045_c0_g1_i1.p1  ORF type:complete len:486 (+),score=80.89 TRINITY_DN13045_c0_g1_i1:28-1458(+)
MASLMHLVLVIVLVLLHCTITVDGSGDAGSGTDVHRMQLYHRRHLDSLFLDGSVGGVLNGKTHSRLSPNIPHERLVSLLSQHGHELVGGYNAGALSGGIWPNGGFVTHIGLSSSNQTQLVQIDTGSSDLLVAQSGCIGCPKQAFVYDPASSPTVEFVNCTNDQFVCSHGCQEAIPNAYRADQCWYNNTYETCDFADPTAKCSLIGPAFYDQFFLPGQSVPSVRVGFGSIYLHAGAFDTEWTNMPGVMGLGYGAIASVWANRNVFDSLSLPEDMFAICINNPKGTGILTVGGADSTLYSGSLSYSAVTDEAWYVMEMLDIAVNGTSLGLPSPTYNKIANGTILDSGTNTLVVNGDAYDIIRQQFSAMCNVTRLPGICNVPANETLFDGVCYQIQPEDLSLFPEVSITLNGTVPLSITGKDYLLPHPEKHGNLCMEIQSSGPGGFTILGNVFMQPFYIVFDRANARLGFAQAAGDCLA